MNRNIYPRGYKRDTSTPGFYFNSYPDNSHLTEVGLSYERFIAGYYEETVKDSIVVHQGVILGKADSGIDLVVVSKKATYLIQCKRYRSDSLIHSNVVSQLFGDANMFKHKFPEAKNVTPVVVAHCGFADDAIENAQVNGIVLKQLPYKAPYHYPGSGYISKIDSDYSVFLRELLIEKQHPELAKPAPVVHPAVKPNQTPPEPSQPPIISNQPAFRDESSTSSSPSVFKDELNTGLPSTPKKAIKRIDPTVNDDALHKNKNHSVIDNGIPLLPSETKKSWWASQSEKSKDFAISAAVILSLFFFIIIVYWEVESLKLSVETACSIPLAVIIFAGTLISSIISSKRKKEKTLLDVLTFEQHAYTQTKYIMQRTKRDILKETIEIIIVMLLVIYLYPAFIPFIVIAGIIAFVAVSFSE